MVGINKVMPCNNIRPVKPRNKSQTRKNPSKWNGVSSNKGTVELKTPIKHIDESA